MRDTAIRRIVLAGVITAAMSTAGCMLIISSDDPHHDRYGDDCEDCHDPVIVVEYKQQPSDSTAAMTNSNADAEAHSDAPAR
jgi:hypothetical protein